MRRPVTSSGWLILTVGVGVGVGVGIFVVKRFIRIADADADDADEANSFAGAIWDFLRRRFRRDRKLEFVGRVTRLCLYPVKACNGVYVNDAYIGR